MDFGEKSRMICASDGWGVIFWFACFLCSCSLRNASMNGIRVRMAVSSLYTPSVRQGMDTEKYLW